MAGVGARAAQIPGAQAAQLGRAQPAVAEDAQQRVVALAGDRAPVGDAQEVGVVGVGERLRRPGLVPRDAHALDGLVQTELAGQRADHRQIHAHGRRRRRPAAAATATWPGGGRRRRSRRRRDRRPPAGGRARRPASRRRRGRSPRTAAACSPSPPGRRSARPRRTGCAPGARDDGRRGGGEARRRRDRPALETSSASTSSSSRSATAGERELPPAHRERLFPKPSMSGHVKPRLGRQEPLEPAGPQVPITEFSDLSAEACGTPLRRPTLLAAERPQPPTSSVRP